MEDEDEDAPEPKPGKLVTFALRAIDATARALQRLRDRFEAPTEDDDSARDDKRRGPPAVDAAEEAPPPRQKSLLHRALVVLLCMLLSTVAGTLVSYRWFARTLEARAALVDHMHEEINQAKKEEEKFLNARDKLNMEMREYRKQLRETELELESSKNKIAELNKKLAATLPAERPAAPGGRTARPIAAKPRPPQKTGTCVTGTTDATGKLLECIDKFNQP